MDHQDPGSPATPRRQATGTAPARPQVGTTFATNCNDGCDFRCLRGLTLTALIDEEVAKSGSIIRFLDTDGAV